MKVRSHSLSPFIACSGLAAMSMIIAIHPVGAQPCVADCNADGRVTVDEVIRGVRIALGDARLDTCPQLDANADGVLTVDDLLAAVKNLLEPWTLARVDVGGHSLVVRCLGEGTPVVVLDAGLGGTTLDWKFVQPQVGGFTRACAYDRAGLGGSDPGPLPRDAAQVVTELRVLLTNSCLPSGYVLVGHSLGGFHVRLFASEHPEDVAGLVTVDGSQEDFEDRIRTDISADLAAALFDAPVNPSLPAVVRAEITAFRQDDPEELRVSAPLPPFPFAVLVAGSDSFAPAPFEKDDPAVQALWEELQAKLAATVPNSLLQVIPDSGHYIQLDQPAAVIDAIRCVVNEVRGVACDPQGLVNASESASKGHPQAAVGDGLRQAARPQHLERTERLPIKKRDTRS